MKLAVAALSLVLIVPGLAQSQAPAPPYLLDPGESPPSVPPPTSTPGSYPSATEPLGHNHPECFATYGKTPAQIEATPCGVGENIAANTTVSACTHNSIIDFQGDNITIDCVKWNAGNAGFATRCDKTAGCKNLTIRRSTITGNNGTGTNQLMLLFNNRTYQIRSVLLEKSDISKSDVLVYVGSVNGDTVPFPGEGNMAVIMRGNRFHHITQFPGAHTDGVYYMNGARGVLFENNLVDASTTDPRVANWGSLVQVQPNDPIAGNYVFRNNHFISDLSDYSFNFGPHVSGVCPSPIYWQNNKTDKRGPTLFSYSRGWPDGHTTYCPTLGSDTNHVCIGNTFENGSPQKCSSNGL